MGNKDFDKFIKDSLENINPAFDPSDWDRMNGVLDQEEMLDDVEFDHFIKEGLGKIKPIFLPGDWDRMNRVLDQGEVLDDVKLDNFVKEGLEKIKPIFVPSDWDHMNGILDQEEMLEDVELDHFVKEGLGNIKPAYQASEWLGMEALLDKKDEERKELIYIKGIEFVLVILAIATLFMYYSHEPSPLMDSPFEGNETIIADIEKSDIESILNVNTDLDKETTDTKNITYKNNQNVLASKTNHISLDVDINDDGSGSDHNNDSNLVPPHSSNNELQLAEVSANNTTIINKGNSSETIINESTAIPEMESNEDVSSEKEDALALDAISTLAEEEIDFKKPEVAIAIKANKPTFRFSSQIGIDRNHVFTAYDQDTKSSFTQGNVGFSSSLRLSILKGKWEFESGLSYTRKQYRPSPIYEITGNTREGYEAETLKKLSFNIISVPLDLRFYLSKMSNKWKFYITSGASFNAVGWSNYDRYFYNVDSTHNTEDLANVRIPTSKSTQHAGILNGESIKDNFYITASLGAGMELSINEKTSFFAQPKFTYYLLPGHIGLGPNNDHFNMISVDLGVRIGL